MRVLLWAILLLSTLAFAEEDCNIVGHVSNITVKQCNSNQDFIQITGNENSQVALENSPGVLIGINSVFVPNKSKDIWMIHRVVGAHTHVVNFFEISDHGALVLIKNGSIGSEIGQIFHLIDASGNLVIETRDVIHNEKHRRLIHEKFILKNDRIMKIK